MNKRAKRNNLPAKRNVKQGLANKSIDFRANSTINDKKFHKYNDTKYKINQVQVVPVTRAMKAICRYIRVNINICKLRVNKEIVINSEKM